MYRIYEDVLKMVTTGIIDTIVRAEGLEKRFGEFTALSGVDLSIKQGEIFGFIGPNGAGKTTTIRILTMLSSPSAGKVTICGHDLGDVDESIREKIGVVQQHISLDRDVTVRENILYHAILHHIPLKEAKKRLSELCSIFNLEPYLDKLVLNLSGGWKRRVAIVCSIIHRPSILFLDEPTAGLDTQSRHTLWNLIRRLNDNGTTIFLTTHYMDEAEALCDRVAIIEGGKITRLGRPLDLIEELGSWTVEYADGGFMIKRHFSDIDDSREFQMHLSADSRPMFRATTLEDVFLSVTKKNETVIEKVRYRV